MADHPWSLALLTYPYDRLRSLTPDAKQLRDLTRSPGSAVVWSMGRPESVRSSLRIVATRPGGVALIVILPPDEDQEEPPELAMELHRLRPHGILPFHRRPAPADLAQVLRRPPMDLAAEVTDYIRWRGLVVDRDTTRLIRRVVDLAGELRSISAVSRSLYMSRRALGRRLMTRGLPVPSHWLHMARLLRVAIRLQNTDATISSVAYEHGYPDAFSLSNQMERLLGYRPSEVRRRLGWEWIVEAWLRKEADTGRLTAPATGGDRPFERAPAPISRPLRRAHRTTSPEQA